MMDSRNKTGRGHGRGSNEAASDTPGIKAAGAMLRKVRLQQGFSIEEIAQATRIQRSHLDAIERGDADALPSGPFVKGFVASYGRHLGVNADELNRALERAAAPAPVAAVEGDDLDGEDPPSTAPAASRRRQWQAAALVGVVAVAGLAAYALRQTDEVAEAPSVPPPLAVEVVQGGPRAESERIVRAASVEAEDGQSYIVFSDLERGDEPHTLLVKANHRSYVNVASELGGEPLFEGIIEEGKSESFSSDEELWVVFGNAGAVDVKYDGKALIDLGLDGDRMGFAFRGP